MLDRSLIVLDLETTGATTNVDRITEIGFVEVDQGRHIGEWSSLVNPERPIPVMVESLTGITDAMVAEAPTFAELARDLYDRLAGKTLVAHNARFDFGFLRNEFRRVGISYAPDVLCTVRLSRRMYPEAVGHGLDSLIARHGLQEAFTPDGAPRTGRHSALGDARAIWRFVQMLYRERDAIEIEAAVKRLLKIPSLPPQLAPDVLDNLPEGPGVYRFYGVNDLPIYIGKSVNLRDRVRSHFSSDYRSANDVRISSEIQRIEVDETAGELGALLKEARLVKELLPLHNHRLRRKLNTVFVRLQGLDSPPEILANKDIDWGARGDGAEPLFGPFATKQQVKQVLENLAAEHGLCWRQLGWEKRGGPCFARQVKKCRGACIGEETPAQHNVRLATALAPLRLADWPWQGRIAVRESHPDGAFDEVHVFERWSHLGTATSEEELAGLAEGRAEIDFDPDVYKILAAYIAKHRGSVRPLARPRQEELFEAA